MASTDSKMYPVGKAQAASPNRWITDKSAAGGSRFVEFGVAKNQRTRVTVAQINAGFTLLPALPGVKWRIIDLKMIAVGGAVTGATDVRLLSTQSGAGAALGIAAVAGLTQSTVLRLGSPFATAGTASIVALADGKSHIANDVNKAVTAGKTGGSAATATAVDFILDYVAEVG